MGLLGLSLWALGRLRSPDDVLAKDWTVRRRGAVWLALDKGIVLGLGIRGA